MGVLITWEPLAVSAASPQAIELKICLIYFVYIKACMNLNGTSSLVERFESLLKPFLKYIRKIRAEEQ